MSFFENTAVAFAIFYGAILVLNWVMKFISWRLGREAAKEDAGILQARLDGALYELGKANDLAQRLKDELQQYHAEVGKLKQELSVYKRDRANNGADADQLRRLRDEINLLRLKLSGYEANPTHHQNTTASSLKMDAQRLDRLIRLCHPDKHDGSDIATETTQWLLAERNTLKRRKT